MGAAASSRPGSRPDASSRPSSRPDDASAESEPERTEVSWTPHQEQRFRTFWTCERFATLVETCDVCGDDGASRDRLQAIIRRSGFDGDTLADAHNQTAAKVAAMLCAAMPNDDDDDDADDDVSRTPRAAVAARVERLIHDLRNDPTVEQRYREAVVGAAHVAPAAPSADRGAGSREHSSFRTAERFAALVETHRGGVRGDEDAQLLTVIRRSGIDVGAIEVNSRESAEAVAGM